MINDSVDSMRVALDAIRPLATYAHGLVDVADGCGDLPDEVKRQLPDFAEMTRKALRTIEGARENSDYDTAIVLTLALLALRALEHPDAAEGIASGARGALVSIAYPISDRYRNLLEELAEEGAPEEVAAD